MGLFNDPNRIPENYGLKTGAGLILFFGLMQLLGLSHHDELRFLNFPIQVVGIYYALKKFKNTHQDHMNYFRGMITGVATGAIGSVTLGVFIFLYMKVDPSLLEYIRTSVPMGQYMNEYMSAFIVALEGLFGSMLVTFVLINYVDTDEVNDPAGESK